jgi:hypothetical protein
MKRFTLMIMLFVAISSATFAQPGGDEHPTATISILDQSGNLVPVNNGQAIAFKDAFIDLVLNTGMGKDLVDSRAGGDKRMVITQADPQQNGNAYQLTYTRFVNNTTEPLFSFLYNVDDNLLYHYQDYDKTWAPVSVEGPAITLLNNCQVYGRFNEQGGTVASNDNYSAPVDTDVTAKPRRHRCLITTSLNALPMVICGSLVTGLTAPPAKGIIGYQGHGLPHQGQDCYGPLHIGAT